MTHKNEGRLQTEHVWALLIESEEDSDTFKIPDIPKSAGIVREEEFYTRVVEERYERTIHYFHRRC